MSTKTAEELAEIQNLPLPELTERLPELSSADLKALRAIEEKGTKRKGAYEAIDAALADKAAADKAGGTAGNATAPAAVARSAADDKQAAPAWQAADYDGPLTIDQASWRRHNIKPVGEVRTK